MNRIRDDPNTDFDAMDPSMGMEAMMGMAHRKPKPIHRPRHDDVPYIVCEVCQTAVKELYRQIATKKASVKHGLSELEIEEVSEGVCDPGAGGGKWLKETRLK